MLHCDLSMGREAKWVLVLHSWTWDKCVTQLSRIFHSSFVSWAICLFSLTLAFTNVYSANENAGDFKASLIFRLKQREKSACFSHGSQNSLLPKREEGRRRKHGMLLFRVMERENQTAPWPWHRQRAPTHGQIISANKSQGCGWVSDTHLAAAAWGRAPQVTECVVRSQAMLGQPASLWWVTSARFTEI